MNHVSKVHRAAEGPSSHHSGRNQGNNTGGSEQAQQTRILHAEQVNDALVIEFTGGYLGLFEAELLYRLMLEQSLELNHGGHLDEDDSEPESPRE